MRALLGGPWASRPRSAALAGLAGAALVDLVVLVALLATDDPARPPAPDPPVAAAPSPADVARTVVQAVADGDCTDLDDVVAADADLPAAVTACLEGESSTLDLADVEVRDTAADGDDVAAVTVGVTADGQPAEIVLDLVRADDRWQVTAVRAG